MKKISIVIISLIFSLNCYSQQNIVVTDTCFIAGHKFVLTDTEKGISQIKAFLKGDEIPVLGTVKMSPPVYFIKKNDKNEILQDDFFIENGDIVKVFLILGNEAPRCSRESRNLKFKDEFCGMNVQGIIISPEGIRLTDFMYNDFICVKENYLGMKDLYTFAHSKQLKKKTVTNTVYKK